jgi:periplasmic copper chaperone A
MPVERQPALARRASWMKQSFPFGSLKTMKSRHSAAAALKLVALLACGVAGPAIAAEAVVVRDAWVRAPAPGQPVAGAYMEITARAKSALVAIASPVAGRSELHSTTMEGGVMKMRSPDRIELAAGRPVKLEPGGLHVMLIDLKRTLKPGEKVPLTLTVERADSIRATINVQAEVRAADGMAMHHH